MNRKIIKSVLHNFLGTYTSRYSDYEGYWLFGMLVRDGMLELPIDLLNRSDGSSEAVSLVVTTASQLAAQKFQEQMEKAGLSHECLREAHLDITRITDLLESQVNGHSRAGYNVQFLASVVSDNGKTFESRKTVFVAPHSSQVELCSNRK